MKKGDSPLILHVVVVGFHHKKGCQVEYFYPSLDGKSTKITDDDLPVEWKHLSSMAIPDGAHNSTKDTIFFHLPCYKTKNRTLFCIACYRQLDADKLKRRSDDITRSTVQKSVCVISSVPLYGLLSAKLEMITQAYFEQCDFDKVELLAEMYESLKESTMSTTQSIESQALFGLSVREVALDFGSRILILFKLILLEKRVLFYIFPVNRLCRTILSLLSLFPGLVEHGLHHCLCARHMDDTPSIETKTGSAETVDKCVDVANVSSFSADENKNNDDSLLKEIEEALNEKLCISGDNSGSDKLLDNDSTSNEEDAGLCAVCDCDNDKSDTFGFPLQIFNRGSVCHPYVSLAYVDWLKSRRIRSFVIGATNALFRQKKHHLDAVVSIEDDVPRIDILDLNLRRSLSLTTADLRFADNIMRCVNQDQFSAEAMENFSNWEGSDEWIRVQFRSYLISLLAVAKSADAIKIADFNEQFVVNWLQTNNFKQWASGDREMPVDSAQGHPFSGQLNVNDVKLRLTHTIHSSEQGRKINQAVSSTGKYVHQTGRTVGNAVKSAVSQWWQGL